MSPASKIRIAIVTPTYQRTSYLAPFIRQVIRQDYRIWKLLIVHDGEDQQTQNLVEGYATRDARILFANTDQRANNFGITPRLLGVRLITECDLADYTVFWDDDNAFFPGALTSIVQSLECTGRPGALLVPVRYQNYILPQPAPVEYLRVGQVDMANFVVRSPVARRVYELVWQGVLQNGRSYTQDFLFLTKLLHELKPANIRQANCQPVGRYDGLRILPTMRWKLGIPYLGLSRFRWVSWLRQRLLPKHFQ
jgi:hypothetical protein